MARTTRRSRRRAKALAATARTVAQQAQEQAAGLAERVRDSDAVEKAAARSAELADKAAARSAELADKAAARGAELADKARDWVREADLDDAVQRAAASVRGRKKPSKRRVPLWMAVLAGLAAGYGIARVARGGSQPALNDDFVASAERLAAPPSPEPSAAPAPDVDLTLSPPATPTSPDSGEGTEHLDASDVTEEAEPAPSGRPLADQVRSHLGSDPRTADLPGLAINVAEGTVFVRGSVPAGFEESWIREVVSSVPGVNDVDLQVTVSG